jgi:hypothetical protein
MDYFLGVPVSSNSMTVMPGQHPPGYYPGQPGQGVYLIFVFVLNNYFEFLASSSWCSRSTTS